MAGEEEVELRDLVAHTLETRGVLGKIRVSCDRCTLEISFFERVVLSSFSIKAQLRASIFLALEEQESQDVRAILFLDVVFSAFHSFSVSRSLIH